MHIYMYMCAYIHLSSKHSANYYNITMCVCTIIMCLVLTASLMPKVTKKCPDIGHEMEYMLATGNLRSRSGLGLQQVSLCVCVCIMCVVVELSTH